ncbi:MAG TPA: 30S ribosomal protein S20 [Verrucomicrobiota bacterium]|nr:30S ribosomal protein S20 [Verrucomicrobiota bacterium]
MANTLSAEKRIRKSERLQKRNRSVKSRLKTLEKKLNALLNEGKIEEARKFSSQVYSGFDKAVKSGVIKKATADRKKSRIATRINVAAAKAVKK